MDLLIFTFLHQINLTHSGSFPNKNHAFSVDDKSKSANHEPSHDTGLLHIEGNQSAMKAQVLVQCPFGQGIHP